MVDDAARGLVSEVQQTLTGVGDRLRSVRTRRNLTLTEVAARTGTAVSTLSRLESGDRRPTLELLLPLAKVYGLTLDDLVDAPDTADPRVHLRPRQAHGMTMIPLTKRPGGIQAFKMVIPAGGSRGEPQLRTHEGYDWVYVLEGNLRLLLGEHDLRLVPGEAAEFDCRTPHWFGATDSGAVEYLSLMGPQGEKAHLRARPGGDAGKDW